MGVDYTAFVCWGQRVKAKRGLVDIFENNSSLLRKHGVGYAEYGSRNYGGDGGYVLMLDHTYTEIDMRREACAKPLPKDRDWDQVRGVSLIQDVLYELRRAGAELETEGDFGWLVCGLVS
jgi:hypothetical protein